MAGLDIRLESRVNAEASEQNGRLTILNGRQDHSIRVGPDVVAKVTMRDGEEFKPNLGVTTLGQEPILTVVRTDPDTESSMKFEVGRRLRGWLKRFSGGNNGSNQDRIVRATFDRRGGISNDVLGAGVNANGDSVIGGRIQLRAGSGADVTLFTAKGTQGEIDVHIV